MKRWPIAVVFALWAHQLVLAWLSPIAGTDWKALVDADGGIVHLALCWLPWLHPIVTPVVAIAVVWALAALALRRWPDPRLADDAIAMVIVSSILWLAAPRAGVVFSYRAAAAAELYGTAAVLAVALVYARASGWIAGRPWSPSIAGTIALVAAAFVAGLTSPHLGTMLLLAIAWHLWRSRALASEGRSRAPWAWAGLVAIVAGAVISWLPDRGLSLVLDRGLAGYVHAVTMALRAPAILGGATALIVMVQIARGRLGKSDNATLAVVGATLSLAIGSTAIVELSSRPDSTQLFAAVAVLAIAVTRVLHDLFADRQLRSFTIAIAVAVQLVIANASIQALAKAYVDARNRLETLAATPKGTIAIVKPYRRISGNPYVVGEDFRGSALRDRVATLRFGLRGITIDPAVRGQEPVPALDLRSVPALADGLWFSSDLATAREGFAEAFERLASSRDVVLQAIGLAVPDRPGVPVVAAWLDGDEVAAVHIAPRGIPPLGTDELGRIRLAVSGTPTAVWALDLGGHGAVQLARDGDTYVVPRGHQLDYAIVACDAARCALGAVIFVD